MLRTQNCGPHTLSAPPCVACTLHAAHKACPNSAAPKFSANPASHHRVHGQQVLGTRHRGRVGERVDV